MNAAHAMSFSNQNLAIVVFIVHMAIHHARQYNKKVLVENL